MTQILAVLVAANTIITFATTAYNLMSARATKALEEIKKLGTRIDQLAEDRKTAGDAIVARFQLVEGRLLKIEAELEHIPDRDQTHRLELAIQKLTGSLETLDERLTGRIDTLDERLKPVVATSARLQHYLMEQGAER